MEKIVIFKKPAHLEAMQRKQKTIDAIWPKIVDHVSASPGLSDDDLFMIYGDACNIDDKKKFITRCNFRGLSTLRETIRNKKTFKKSAQLTEKRILSIEEKRKKNGNQFLSRMDRVVKAATTSLEEESLEVAKGKAHLGEHIGNMRNLVKVGKDVYNFDATSGEDTAKMNIAILMGFDPMANQQPDVIEV